MSRNWSSLGAILLWEAAVGLAASTLVGAAAGLQAIRVNAYLSQHLANTALYTFRLHLNHWVITGLIAALVIAAVTCLCFASANRRRAIGLFVAVPLAVFISYLVGYDINRFDFKSYWVARRTVLGMPLRGALLEPMVLLADIGVLTVSLAGGWVAFKLVNRGMSRVQGRGTRLRLRARPQWIAIAAAACVLVFNGYAAAHRHSHRAVGPNVILISLDTLRRDHLGCYGYSRDVSPNIDRLAGTSVLFENAITQAGSTLSSHKSILTSVYPPMLRVPGDQRLDFRRQTVAEILMDKGYDTAAFANGLGWVTPVFRFDQGFGKYVVPSRRIVPQLASAGEITRLGLAWVRKHTRSPFFLFLHYGDIHSDWKNRPYDAPEPYGSMFLPPGSERFDRSREQIRGSNYLSAINWGRYNPSPEEIEYLKALYDGGIRYTDNYIGVLVEGLKNMGLLDKTVLVILADHGEEFREHGRMLHGWVHCEVARVPLVIRFPDGRWGGTRVADQVELLDVVPTVLAYLGVAPGPEMRGRNLLVRASGEDFGAVAPGSAFTEGENAYAIRCDGWMYLLNFEDGHRELYNLNNDPLERADLVGQVPAEENRLAETLLGWVGKVEARALREGQEAPAHVDRKTRELLKSLGYLQSGK